VIQEQESDGAIFADCDNVGVLSNMNDDTGDQAKKGKAILLEYVYMALFSN
jgi:hypothetical protein